MTIEYEEEIIWIREGHRTWKGYAGQRHVATIYDWQGTLRTTWFEHHSDDVDNSVSGSFEFLQNYIQEKWTNYLNELKSNEG